MANTGKNKPDKANTNRVPALHRNSKAKNEVIVPEAKDLTWKAGTLPLS
jgi:hypothetical protein